MKHYLSVLVVMVGLLVLPRQSVQANDYMEHTENYTVYASGIDKIHFSIPVWVHGAWYEKSYSALPGSHFSYKVDTEDEVTVLNWLAHVVGENDSDNDKGTLAVKYQPNQGQLFLTCMHNGVRTSVKGDGNWSDWLTVKQKPAGGYDRVTILEFDWYPPADLDGKEFTVKMYSEFDNFGEIIDEIAYSFCDPLSNYGDIRCYEDHVNPDYKLSWQIDNTFKGKEPLVAPTLFEPYLYQLNEDGTAGYGYAAIPYSLQNEPVSYTLSMDTTVHYATELAGNIFILTNDTIQKDISAKFAVWRNKEENKTVDSIVSTKVDLKPYHRIYDFVAQEETDSTDTYTGANVLSWSIKNPLLSDLVDGDYFEIIRATDTSFANAASLAVIPMVMDSFGVYSYRDEDRNISTGHLDGDSLTRPLVYAPEGYFTLTNQDNKPMFLVKLQIQTDKAVIPSLPVYYRIRRASSAIWGWHEDFTKQQMVYKHNFLAPLADEQPQYTKDADFETNHQVHFSVLLKNEDVPTVLPAEDVFELGYTVAHAVWDSTSLPASGKAEDLNPDDYMPDSLKKQLKDSLYKELKEDYEAHPFGKCMWDKTANLILIRTIEETGKSTESIIPADSIRRLENGDWMANFTDVADQACLHYRYSVRIDQSHADLHVRTPQTQLVPVALTGPELYFDESARIESFTATQGDTRSDLKQGVLLAWKPTSSAVDEYILYRIMIGSSEAPDTLYTGLETSFMDRTAIPDVHYEYTVSSYYNCNGKSTSHFATTEGWRTAYGEISGTILMPDNSGMAGVTVALQDSTGTVIRTLVTDGTGSYTFDSLSYYQVICQDMPKVKIRYSHYAQVMDPTPFVRIRISDADGSVQKDWSKIEGGTYSYPVGTKLEIKTTEDGNENKDKVYTVKVAGNSEIVCENQAHTEGEMHIIPSFKVSVSGEESFVPCKTIQSSANYVVIPTHEYGVFSYNYTDAGTAAITLSMDNAAATQINFANTKATRLTGRALYDMSTVPVAGAMFRLNGDTVRRGGAPLTTGTDGNFELTLTTGQPYTLQIFKEGHTFAQDGFFQKEEGVDTFYLDKPLDGIRFYDETKVRLVGRVAGGIDQRELPEAFGLGKNNLGDDLQLVLQLEGDNVAHLVHDPDDISRDTLQQTVDHLVYTADSVSPTRVVGTTHTLFEKKRVVIQPDPNTGEFEVDLYPVKYKVSQASARGYATLFTSGTGNEIFDLTKAPTTLITDTLDGDTVRYNATYDRIYRSPVQVELIQNLYGLERPAYGEPEMAVNGANPNKEGKIALYTVDKDKNVTYTLGYPVFIDNRKYQFKAKAYEAYYFNNDPSGNADIVPQRGGTAIIRNGLYRDTEVEKYPLNEKGENNVIWLSVNDVDVEHAGTAPLRSVSIALETEGNVVEANVFSAFVAGTIVEEKSIRASGGNIQLLDIIRDPGGSGSYAYVENGAEYTFNFTQSLKAKFGIQLTPTWGQNVTQYIGVYTGAPAGGSWIGSAVQTQKAFSFDIPIAHFIDFGLSHTCRLTTNERIYTSSNPDPTGVGSPADVFFGTTVANLIGNAKSISIIDDSLYQMCKPSFDAGTMLLLAQGNDTTGKPYYLVTGQKVYVSAQLDNTFTYSQYYIWNTLIPRLAMERQNLLKDFTDADAAQAYADATGKPAYWYYRTGNYLNDTIPLDSYKMFTPNDGGIYTDEVGALNMAITRWLEILYLNEREKVEARTKGTKIGTFTSSFGNSYSHTDTYNYEYSYNEYPQNMALMSDGYTAGGTAIGSLIYSVFKNRLNTSALSAFLQTYWKQGNVTTAEADDETAVVNKTSDAKKVEQVAAKVGNMTFSMGFDIIYDMASDRRMTTTASTVKSSGFSLVADPMGEITTSVYKAELDQTWYDNSKEAMETVAQADNERLLYGSYVFFTEAGATICPHEEEETTLLYNPGSKLNNSTMWVAKPELAAEVYEMANVAPDKRASFRIQLFNQGQMDAGYAEKGQGFYLSLDGASNPDGAKVYVNGTPLQQPVYYWILPSEPITQTIEVERGMVDDYNLSFLLYSEFCATTAYNMNLGVHFLPVSTDVEVASPRQNWVMNTLSQRDSNGYYLPITIDGFDIHHKNFDHIEFQYKLSSESDEKWVNQCSFFANDSLYALATGNKAMIENGRITPFRFYGERDPMEQKYDLRAVSFCRYGSGYVTKASPVISGVKDTRPPRVFGHPEPANSILSVDKNLSLRFNEPIAGNYLDEDNNFRIVGITNETGITASTALQFDGSYQSYAATKANRSLANHPFTVEMYVKPVNADQNEVFFSHGDKGRGISFGKTADNRLYINIGNGTPVYSKQLSDPMLSFTRVLFTFDSEKGVRFYVGSLDVTDENAAAAIANQTYSVSAPLIFGKGFNGSMLEARVWTKALTEEEIAATLDHYLNGYERELLAYYHMNEGKDEHVNDNAHGATLYLNGCTWNKKKGFSLHLDKQAAKLNGNLLGLSAAYDESILFWYRTTGDGTLFSANNLRIAIEQGNVLLYNGDKSWKANGEFADDEWHHFVMTVNRSLDNVALYIDDKLYLTFPAVQLSGITGAMYLGGDGFVGNIDEFAIFEQALPRTLIESSNNMAFVGDEMGLMGYLPFEEQYTNPSGVLTLRFSVNDRRQFKDANGNVIDKVVPLLISQVTEEMKDMDQNAPVNDHGQLTKLRFDWSFNNDELMVNVLNQDYEINKQSIYITIRDVEDLNGNPMTSPVTWVAFVDHTPLKWSAKQISVQVDYGQDEDIRTELISIINNSGMRHTYSIESLPQWLTVDKPTGAVDPQGEIILKLNFDLSTPVGKYSDIIYLVDENGLNEALMVEFDMEAVCPYDEPDKSMYPLNMSLCGQVLVDGTIDIDNNDRIMALYHNKCIGMTNVDFDDASGTSKVFLTIFGNEKLADKVITFQLWQASTGNIFNLNPDTVVTFSHGAVYGCGNDSAVIFSTTGKETQNITLDAGWNWISTNLNFRPETAPLNGTMAVSETWQEGDVIKAPATRQFSTYSMKDDRFVGTLTGWDYTQMYMVFAANGNSIRFNGALLEEQAKYVSLYGNNQWNAMPCLFNKETPIAEALADYFDHALPGDLIKAHNRFAVFSQDKKWEGDLKTLRPGEGYLFRRLGDGAVTVHFYNQNTGIPKAPHKESESVNLFTNPNAATNMTMIATMTNNQSPITNDQLPIIMVYIGDELAGVAEPLRITEEQSPMTNGEALYFLTIQSNAVGQPLRFETEDGIVLSTLSESGLTTFYYESNDHHGSIKSPVRLVPVDNRPYKTLENGHVVIIRNNDKYSIDGKKL